MLNNPVAKYMIDRIQAHTFNLIGTSQVVTKPRSETQKHAIKPRDQCKTETRGKYSGEPI